MLNLSLSELKRKISKLIEEDEEFRYFIASKIGLLEILKRLDKHDEKFNQILAKMAEYDKKFNQILAKIAEHDRKCSQILAKIAEHDEKFNQILAKMAEYDEKFNQILARIAEHDRKFNHIMSEIATIKREIRDIKQFEDRLAVSLEEEAHEVIEYLLEKNYGIRVRLERLTLERAEIDIYGITDNLCIFGEASVRLGLSMIDELLNKVRFMKRKNAEYLRDNVILILYGLRILPKIIEEAKKHGIWVVTATKELTELKTLKLSDI